MKESFRNIRLVLFVAAFSFIETAAFARGAARPAQASDPVPTSRGKPVLAISPVERVRIELPDGEVHDFGADFQVRLITRLTQGGKFVIADTPRDPEASVPRTRMSLRATSPDPFVWEGSFIPSARLSVRVHALNLRTGLRGNRMFYGFDERARTPFNDGSGNKRNEFPVTSFGASWFGDSFQAQGDTLTGSLSGLDLGEGLSLNLIFVWFTAKWAKYRSELRLDLELDSPLSGRHEIYPISVEGSGYFYDVVAGYEAWGVALNLARRTAMLEAFQNAIEASLRVAERASEGLPLTGVIDGVDSEGRIFLGTGAGAQVASGVVYESVENPALTLQVTQSVASGAVTHALTGELSAFVPGMIFREKSANSPKAISMSKETFLHSRAESLSARSDVTRIDQREEALVAASEKVVLPEKNLSKPDFGSSLPPENFIEAYFRSLIETVTLPYRLWRYEQYDRAYASVADDGAPALPAEARVNGPVIAVIDSGVDYNHPVLHPSLWLNSEPLKDSSGTQDRYGWDFISGDSRPFDDHFHGTRVASAVLLGNPQAQIMAIKAFNPWGVTQSSALLSSFHYAVDHGARVILCAWATPVQSDAIEEGIRYAETHGVPVVVSPRPGRSFPAAFSGQLKNIVVPDSSQARNLIGRSFAEPRLGEYRPMDPNDPALLDLLAGFVAGQIAAEYRAQ